MSIFKRFKKKSTLSTQDEDTYQKLREVLIAYSNTRKQKHGK